MSWIRLQLHIAITYCSYILDQAHCTWYPHICTQTKRCAWWGVGGGAPAKHTKHTALGGGWVGGWVGGVAAAKRTALGGGWVGPGAWSLEPGAPAKRTKRTPRAVLAKNDSCWNYTKN